MKGIRKALVICSAFIVGSCFLSYPCWGAGPEFAGQVVVGTVGGALFGALGNWVGIRVCQVNEKDGVDSAEHCWEAGMYGYLLGVPLGATLGVGWAGSSFGMRGDHLLAAVGAVVGEALGAGILVALQDVLPGPEAAFATAYGLVPFLSAALSATGYHSGADDPRGKRLDATFLSLCLGKAPLPEP